MNTNSWEKKLKFLGRKFSTLKQTNHPCQGGLSLQFHVLDKVSLTDFVSLGFVCLRYFFMLSLPNSGPEMQNDHLWLEKKKMVQGRGIQNH